MTKPSRILQTEQVSVAATGVIHERIHLGEFFTAELFGQALADDASLEVLIQVSSELSMHTRVRAGAGGDAVLYLFENTTFSDVGVVLAPINRNRFSSNTPLSVLTSSPTLTGDGVQLDAEFLPGGGAFLSSGALTNLFEEWILKTDTAYLARVTNISGAVQPVTVEVDFYEPRSGVKR